MRVVDVCSVHAPARAATATATPAVPVEEERLELRIAREQLADERDRGGKSAVKEKFTRFFDLLDEVTERHQFARVLADDPEGRATVADEAVKLVVPSLQRFIQRNLGKEFSKSECAASPFL